MLNIESNNEQKVKVNASPVTNGGAPAQVEGALTVTVQSGPAAPATVVQDPADPLGFYAVSGDGADALGDTVFLVEADANLDPGVVTTISELVTYRVTSPQATSFGLSANTPEPK